jgi:hypothetical protein
MHETSMDLFTDENLEFQIFNFFRNFQIKNSKKTSLHFKNFGQNGIEKHVVCRPEKIEQVCTAVKSGKKI